MRRLATAAVVLTQTIAPGVWAQPGKEEPRVPAAWITPEGERDGISGTVDLRAFYHHTGGKGDRRPAWSGGELLSYFDAMEGLSGAFILRHEAREQIGDYGLLMLVPRIAPEKYLVASVAFGNGAPFFPVTRMDLQLRGFFGGALEDVMYDVGSFTVWWPSDAVQIAGSGALIFWRQPLIVEARGTFLAFNAPRIDWHPNFRSDVIVLYGADRDQWLTVRLSIGNEPENVPGMDFADTRDLLVMAAAVGYKRWVTAHHGIAGEIEGFGQLDTWYRFGITTSVFAAF